MGMVYVLKSPNRKEIKIGVAEYDEKERLGVLRQGDPRNYYIRLIKADGWKEIEKALHKKFKEFRYEKTEWFDIPPKDVFSYFDFLVDARLAEYLIHEDDRGDEINIEDDEKNMDDGKGQEGTRRDNTNILSIVPEGAHLTFLNDENITAKVIDDRTIEFRGESTTMSGAANDLLQLKWRVNGARWWMYEGKSIYNRRLEKEEEKET